DVAVDEVGRDVEHVRAAGPAQRRRAGRRAGLARRVGGFAAARGGLIAIASISTRSSGRTRRENTSSGLGGYAPARKYAGKTSWGAALTPGMSSALVRKVCSLTMSRMGQPAAPRTAATLAKACLVCEPASVPASPPSGFTPTCPATTTRLLASMPCEYI